MFNINTMLSFAGAAAGMTKDDLGFAPRASRGAEPTSQVLAAMGKEISTDRSMS